MLAVFLVSIGLYTLFGWEAGSDALDSDTTSLLTGWKMMRQGQTMDRWILATPKFLPVVLDGALFEVGGFGAVLARSVVSAALIVTAGAAFVYSLAGVWPAVLAAGFLLLNGQMLILTMGGNSSILGAGFVAAALLVFLDGDSPPKWMAGMALLFAAGLARSELLVFLPLAAAACAWLGWRSRSGAHLLAAGGGAALIGLAVLLDMAVPSRLTGTWTNSRDISIDLAKLLANQVEAYERLDLDPDFRLEHHRALEDSYAANLRVLIPRLLRPLPLFLFTGLAGMAYLWRRDRRAALLLAAPGFVPLAVGWLIHANTGGLYERYYVLSMMACLIASSLAYFAAWNALKNRSRGRWALAGKVFVAAIALGGLAVGARDVYNQRRGYLRQVSSDLREFREGIQPLIGVDLREKRFLMHGWHWGYANLVLDTDPTKVIHDDDLASMQSPRRFPCQCDYYFYRRGSKLTDALLGIGPGPVRIACMEPYWRSANGAYEFFRRDTKPGSSQ